jgi:hypothetical protein
MHSPKARIVTITADFVRAKKAIVAASQPEDDVMIQVVVDQAACNVINHVSLIGCRDPPTEAKGR